MSVSQWFSDEELISQLKMFFDEDERENIDFNAVLGNMVNVDDDLMQVKVKNRVFEFSIVSCGVVEVELDD